MKNTITNEQRREALTARILRDLNSLKEKNLLIEEARWLNSNSQLDQNLMLSSQKKIISDKLLTTLIGDQKRYKYKINQKQINLEVLIANLLYSKKLDRPVSLSMMPNSYPVHKKSRITPFVIEAVHLLHKGGYLGMKIGYSTFKDSEYSKSRNTRIWPDKTLIELFGLGENDIIFKPPDLINLKTKPVGKDGKKSKKRILIDYVDTKETRRVRNILRKINKVNRSALIQQIIRLNKTTTIADSLQTDLHVVYTNDFNHGGRLYTSSLRGYQALSEEERATILINNKKTIELDFSGLHPHILYAWEGIQHDSDPYNIIPDIPNMRQIFKKVFLSLLNAENEIMAVSAGNKFLYDHQKYYNLMCEYGLKIKEDLIPMFKEKHAPIAHYFCKGTGLKVMNLDAKIALEILRHFTDKRIPILTIHDSFIIWQHLKEELKEVMQATYKKFTNGFHCPVKESKKRQPQKRRRMIKKRGENR